MRPTRYRLRQGNAVCTAQASDATTLQFKDCKPAFAGIPAQHKPEQSDCSLSAALLELCCQRQQQHHDSSLWLAQARPTPWVQIQWLQQLRSEKGPILSFRTAR